MSLAERMAAHPQASLVGDRQAVLGAWGRRLEEGLALEAEVGLAAAKEPEMFEATRRFLEQ